MNNTLNDSLDYADGCPACAQTRVTCREIDERFEYGTGAERIEVGVRLPLLTCVNCGFSFTDETAEERRHEAVCAALNVLTPYEVRVTRERLGLSQAEFSTLSGIGKASLSRWERGSLIQSESNDNLLRLLSHPENVQRLREKSERRRQIGSANAAAVAPKFRALQPAEQARLREQAASFNLYG